MSTFSSNRSDDLMQKIHSGKFVLMDGAMGTELERRGAPIEGTAWSATAILQHANLIRETHEDYISAGARLHIVNSFSLAKHVLEPAGLGSEFEQLNTQAVMACLAAIENSNMSRNEHYVAGSLSTFAANSDRTLLPVGSTLVSNFRQQAEILSSAGVDLFALEMLFDIDTSLAMLEATADIDLPLIVGLTCDRETRKGNTIVTGGCMGPPTLPLDEILPSVIKALLNRDAILSIMHSTIDVTQDALAVLRNHWNGPIAIYPNSGEFHELQLEFDSVCSTNTFFDAALEWKSSGVNIIGGCCGIGPQHIKKLDTW